MGWWRIDPDTGKPLRDGHSRLSCPPGFVLLNALPGVDKDEEAHYLGDSPWDMAYSAVNKIKAVITLWKNVDWCYEEVWERPARFAERVIHGSEQGFCGFWFQFHEGQGNYTVDGFARMPLGG